MSAKVKCSVCGHVRDKDACHEIIPTVEEVAALTRMGDETPGATRYFCRPCKRLFESKASAQALMRGVVRSFAKSVGAGNADEVADSFQKALNSKHPKDA